MPTLDLDPLAPEEQVEALRAKGLEPSLDYEDTLRAVKDDAFAITGITSLDLLEDLREALADSIESGEGYGAFAERAHDILDEHGWGMGGNRLKTIYEANLQSAISAARDDQIEQVARDRMEDFGEETYCRFSGPDDEHECEECDDYNGAVFLWDDPIWEQVTPPIHRNCRHIKESLSASDALEAGWDIEEEEAA